MVLLKAAGQCLIKCHHHLDAILIISGMLSQPNRKTTVLIPTRTGCEAVNG